MTDNLRRTPLEMYERGSRSFPLAPLKREGYPDIDDPGDPCWSLMNTNWPGLTADEATEIVRKTRATPEPI